MDTLVEKVDGLDLHGYTVLIIDDEPANLGVMSDYLRQSYCRVLIARSGEMGLERAYQNRPDLILLDVRLPGLDGFEVCRQLKGNPDTRDIPVIFMTVLGGTEDKLKGFQAGGVDYITKPIQQAEALARILTHLRLRALTAELQEAKQHLELRVEERTAALAHAIQELERENAERRRVEEALREAEAKYRSIFENASEGIFQSAPSGTILTANPALARMLGYASPAELIALVTDFQGQHHVRPERRAEFQRLLEAHGSVRGFEVELYRKDGSTMWGSVNARIARGPDGQVRYYEGSNEDITERKQAEEALRHSEERYRDLYDNAPDGYCVVDVDGLIREMNATQLSWLGYERMMVIDRMRLEDLLLPEERPMIAQLLERCKREGQLEHVERTLVGSADRRLPVRLNMRAIYDPAGRCSGYRVTTREITKEKALEAQLVQGEKLKSLGTLAGGIAHDFNNVLTGILGFTQLLLEEVGPESRMYGDLRQIEVLGMRAAAMVSQLMTFARHSGSQKNSLALRPFLDELIGLLGHLIPEHITMVLYPVAEDLSVKADPVRLQQVLMNLVVNARDAMPKGGLLAMVVEKVELDELFCQTYQDLQPGAYARLQVSDTGIGIPAAIRPYIFDPFFTTKTVGQGTGLGLSVVYGIIKEHRGAIEVESEVGKGTSIKLYLPLVATALLEETPPSVGPLRGSAVILLVEDEPSVLAFGRAALEHLGYQVLAARDGVEALEVFQAHAEAIKMAILDVVMPRMGGRETARELKRRSPALQVLLVTGHDSVEEPDGRQGEAEEFALLRKPYGVRDLAQAVWAALENQPQIEGSTQR